MLALFKAITTFVFDMDGVLTDGTLYIFDNGEQVRRMNIKDGFALQLAIKKGYRVVVISGSHSDAAVQRLSRLGITDVFMRVEDKQSQLNEYLSQHNIPLHEVLFMGDDIPDLPLLKIVGLPCVPSDGSPDLKAFAKYISDKPGGMGCVRDVIEKVLKLNNHWETETSVRSL